MKKNAKLLLVTLLVSMCLLNPAQGATQYQVGTENGPISLAAELIEGEDGTLMVPLKSLTIALGGVYPEMSIGTAVHAAILNDKVLFLLAPPSVNAYAVFPISALQQTDGNIQDMDGLIAFFAQELYSSNSVHAIDFPHFEQNNEFYVPLDFFSDAFVLDASVQGSLIQFKDNYIHYSSVENNAEQTPIRFELEGFGDKVYDGLPISISPSQVKGYYNGEVVTDFLLPELWFSTMDRQGQVYSFETPPSQPGIYMLEVFTSPREPKYIGRDFFEFTISSPDGHVPGKDLDVGAVIDKYYSGIPESVFPSLTLDKTTYSPGEAMSLTLAGSFSGDIYIEILWSDKGLIVSREAVNKGLSVFSAPCYAGRYVIRLYCGTENIASKGFSVVGSPSVPTLLNAQVVTGEDNNVAGINLSWEQEDMPEPGYILERESSDGTVRLTPADASGWVDVDVLPNTSYTYCLKKDNIHQSNPVVVTLSSFQSSEYAANRNDQSIILWPGRPAMLVNGDSVPIDPTDPRIVPVAENNYIRLPIRAVIEAMGGTVDWDGARQLVLIEIWGKHVEIPLGGMVVRVNGEVWHFPVATQARNGRTLVPIRCLEAIGCEVDWLSEYGKVLISYSGEE